MEQVKTDKLAELKTSLTKSIEKYNEALSCDNLKEMNEQDAEQKKLEAEYAEFAAKQVYNDCLATENPIKTAIERYSFHILGHKDTKVDGVVVDRVLVEDRTRQIDLLKLCKYSKDIKAKNALSTDWQYPVAKFNQLLCMRAAKELKFNAKQIKDIASTFYMEEVARKMDLGETPDSNTQICKLLQTCIDSINFVDDGKGKNIYKVNNHDVAYLIMLYTRKGKNALSVQVAKHDFLRRLITDVMYRCLTDGKYSLEYKQIKVNK